MSNKITPEATLEALVVDPTVPRTQIEHWAAREIERLTRERDKARAEVKRLRADRRERITTAALAGLLASPGNISTPIEWWVSEAFVAADAMIAELDREGGR